MNFRTFFNNVRFLGKMYGNFFQHMKHFNNMMNFFLVHIEDFSENYLDIILKLHEHIAHMCGYFFSKTKPFSTLFFFSWIWFTMCWLMFFHILVFTYFSTVLLDKTHLYFLRDQWFFSKLFEHYFCKHEQLFQYIWTFIFT